MKARRAKKRVCAWPVLACIVALAGCDRKKQPESASEEERPEASTAEAAVPEPVARALEFYSGRPTFEQPVARGGEVRGLPDLRAETCGACHQEIYREWKVSTHRRAWADDAQFMAELEKSRGANDPKRGDVGWLCVNCHTPMIEQIPKLVVDLEEGQIDRPVYVDNPEFDAGLQMEAITCATCHVRDGVVFGPYGSDRAPHPVKRDESLLTVDPCVRCHQAEQFYTSQNLGCFFTTGREWFRSPPAEEGRTCQSCHMPEVERPIATGDYPARRTRRHWFGGSLIPKKPQWTGELEPLKEVYGDGVTIRLEPMTDTLRTTLQEQPELAAPDAALAVERREACSSTPCTTLALVVTNDRAGHHVPTGDPERHFDVQVVVQQGDDVVSREWTRFGSRYEWWPKTRLLADTRIPSGESRVLSVEVPRDGEAIVDVRAEKYRMYPEAFEHHQLQGEYVRGRTFLERTWSVRDGEVVDDATVRPAPP